MHKQIQIDRNYVDARNISVTCATKRMRSIMLLIQKVNDINKLLIVLAINNVFLHMRDLFIADNYPDISLNNTTSMTNGSQIKGVAMGTGGP